MMTTTHAGMGATVGALLVPVAPALAPTAALAGIAGGIVPDLDVALEHRKSLHYPVGFSLLAVISGVAALLATGTATVAAFGFFVGAALHCTVEILGGGLAARPWIADDDRGVYEHLTGSWIPPRRWIRYDGAPEDLLATVAFAVLPFLVFGGLIRGLVVVGVVVGAAYVLLRKRLPDLYERYVASAD